MNDICILYNGGAYGTFVEWFLNYFSDPNMDSALPFNTNGNAHQYHGNPQENFQHLLFYINSSQQLPFVRSHPKLTKDERLLDNLTAVSDRFNKVIYVYPTADTIAWNINNKFEKIYSDGWLNQHKDLVLQDLSQWGISSLDSAEPWQLREFLSYYIYPQHLAECDLNLMPEVFKQHNNFKFISMNQLRDQFNDTVIDLLHYCNLDPIRLDLLEQVYNHWISLQYHCHKDQLINDIISAVINSTDYSWSNLTLVDEALIQYHLRSNNIELRCFQLNTLPTNTVDLKKYLYRN